MSYTCPVCGYDRLLEPPMNYAICPCCGTEFGYDDSGVAHPELRLEWVEAGATWHSRRASPPLNWNPIEQLKRAGLWPVSYVPAGQEVVRVLLSFDDNISISAKGISGYDLRKVFWIQNLVNQS